MPDPPGTGPWPFVAFAAAGDGWECVDPVIDGHLGAVRRDLERQSRLVEQALQPHLGILPLLDQRRHGGTAGVGDDGGEELRVVAERSTRAPHLVVAAGDCVLDLRSEDPAVVFGESDPVWEQVDMVRRAG